MSGRAKFEAVQCWLHVQKIPGLGLCADNLCSLCPARAFRNLCTRCRFCHSSDAGHYPGARLTRLRLKPRRRRHRPRRPRRPCRPPRRRLSKGHFRTRRLKGRRLPRRRLPRQLPLCLRKLRPAVRAPIRMALTLGLRPTLFTAPCRLGLSSRMGASQPCSSWIIRRIAGRRSASTPSPHLRLQTEAISGTERQRRHHFRRNPDQRSIYGVPAIGAGCSAQLAAAHDGRGTSKT